MRKYSSSKNFSIGHGERTTIPLMVTAKLLSKPESKLIRVVDYEMRKRE